MDTWLIAMKFLLLAYVAVAFALRGETGGALVVLFALGYASASILAILLRRVLVRQILLLVALAAALAAFFAVDRDFSVLLPLSAAELVFAVAGSLVATVTPAILVGVFVPADAFAAYLLAGGLSLAGFALLVRLHGQVATAEKEIERLRASNEQLHRTAELRSGYEDELASLARLEERNRLSQEIHDRVGHAISGGIIQLEAAAAVLDSDREAARSLLDNSVRVLRSGMDGIRTALRGIKPAAEELGIHRIRGMLDKFSADTGVRTFLEHAGDLGLVSHLQWKLVMDNLRECLTNTLRHAGASSVRVGIEVMNRLIKAEVRDDGRGALSPSPGLGLAGMEERTQGLGGKLIVDGSRGFSVITILPLGEVRHGD
jgi:signal transduction histidine kinase